MSEDAATYNVNPEVYPEVNPEVNSEVNSEEELESLLTYDEKMMDLYLTLDQLDEDINSLRELIIELEQLKENIEEEIVELRDS